MFTFKINVFFYKLMSTSQRIYYLIYQVILHKCIYVDIIIDRGQHWAVSFIVSTFIDV